MALDILSFVDKSPKMTEAEELPILITVYPYDRHVFLAYKNVENWAPITQEADKDSLEEADKDSLPQLLADALINHAHETPIRTRMSISEGPYGADSSDGDVFVFPDMVKYRGLTNKDADKFVEDVLVNGKDWVSGPAERLPEGTYVFVCSHARQDKRYDPRGPQLIEKFKEEIESRAMKDQVFVGPCSHVGGRGYAGNLVIFNRNSAGVVIGNWYGYTIPEDVPALVDQHIVKGDVIKILWRGQMLAVRGKYSQKIVEEKPVENGGTALTNGTVLEKGEKEESQASTEGGDMGKDAGSCCQGLNGVSACSEEKVEDATNVKKATEGIHSSSQERLSAWMNGKFKQRQVFAGLAVVGAVVYSIYRRSGGVIKC
ncbi:hypothetical protein MKW94_010005 [Papaver nudicaule]|uniref:Altered inheritance of mitochondria protein 32 n=1 Tax=Papaver nudicaule TaxID=74823 RepID=A0AA42AVD9_PAPNU|nr:hypothetical protein [Papaver nudicaule]